MVDVFSYKRLYFHRVVEMKQPHALTGANLFLKSEFRRKLEHFLVREYGAVHAHIMAPDLAVPALADAAVHVGFEGRIDVRGLHAELHEVTGDGLDAAG